MISVSACIMHASFSPDRRLALHQLIMELERSGVRDEFASLDVMSDPSKMGPQWNSKRCWERGAKSETSHHLVMQDDIAICKNFCQGVKSVIEAFPDDCIGLFYGPRKNFDGSSHWGEAEGPWGQAIIMPIPMIKEYLDWSDQHLDPNFKHDDSRLSLFLHKTGRTAKIPFPNLVDHRDGELKSVSGNSWNKPRVSASFMGKTDPCSINWNDKSGIMKSINSLSRYYEHLIA